MVSVEPNYFADPLNLLYVFNSWMNCLRISSNELMTLTVARQAGQRFHLYCISTSNGRIGTQILYKHPFDVTPPRGSYSWLQVKYVNDYWVDYNEILAHQDELLLFDLKITLLEITGSVCPVSVKLSTSLTSSSVLCI